MSNYLILISRLNGLLEIINCIPSNDQNDYQFDLIHSIRISNSPITNLIYEGNYLIATSQEFLFKIVKFNFDYVSFTSNQNVKNQFFVSSWFRFRVVPNQFEALNLMLL